MYFLLKVKKFFRLFYFYQILSVIHKVTLPVLLGKAISQSVCLDPALHLLNKFAKGNNIKNSLKVFVSYCFNHKYNLKEKTQKVNKNIKLFYCLILLPLKQEVGTKPVWIML